MRSRSIGALEESKVDMHVEGLRLESTESVGSRTEHLAHRGEVSRVFFMSPALIRERLDCWTFCVPEKADWLVLLLAY